MLRVLLILLLGTILMLVVRIQLLLTIVLSQMEFIQLLTVPMNLFVANLMLRMVGLNGKLIIVMLLAIKYQQILMEQELFVLKLTQVEIHVIVLSGII
jgi:hypothetical protein